VETRISKNFPCLVLNTLRKVLFLVYSTSAALTFPEAKIADKILGIHFHARCSSIVPLATRVTVSEF